MPKFRVHIELPAEYVVRNVRASGPQEALERAEAALQEASGACSREEGGAGLPAPRRVELDFVLEAYVEQVTKGGDVVRSYNLRPGSPWKVVSQT